MHEPPAVRRDPSEIEHLTRELSAIVGEANVLADHTSLMTYECDGATLYQSTPDCVVFPTTTDQVSRIVKLANKLKIPYLARGTGTGLSGGCTSVRGGIVIALNRMDRILELDVENRRAIVEPGVVNLWITDAAAPHGYHYAPDPSSQKACTIGGNVAENAGGPHTIKYGVTVNHIAALEIVLPSGEVVEFGGECPDPVGYDLMGVFIGSEGTLGIATKIAVKLTRDPQARKTLLAVFGTIDEATSTVSEIIADGIIPAALEMMDRLVIQAVEEAFHFGFPDDAAAVLIVELEGIEAGMDGQAAQITSLFERFNARDVRVARDETERELLWKCRKSAFGALGRLAPCFLTQDGVVPRTRLPEVLRKCYEVSEKYGLPIANVFHAGDGNIHPILLFRQEDPEQCELVLKASGEILLACVEAGGTITGEHGVGIEKMEFMPLIFTPQDLALMRDVQTVFDPDGLCNPGKIFPSEDEERWGIRVNE